MEFLSEDDVKIHHLPKLLSDAGYQLDDVGYNVGIEVKQGRKARTIFADAVVYSEPTRGRALVVVETKPPTPPLTPGDADQAFSYARLLTPIAPFVLLTNGTETKAYDTFTKKLLPQGLPTSGQARVAAKRGAEAKKLAEEAKHELFKVDSVDEYKRILRACHNSIRNNEGYDPTKAFDELSKVMFTKLFEEKSGKERFRLKKFDDLMSSNINIIQQIFRETSQSQEYSGLFLPNDTIELSDRTIRELVGHFENFDLSLTDFDVKGEAFEHFLGSTFTGGLGQYFTPRNVVNFMVEVLSPKVGETVVDPFCGTGGFLIAWHSFVTESIDAMSISADLKAGYLETLNKKSLFGIDWNERTSLACRMNMTMHGEGESANNIFKQSGFVDAIRSGSTVIGDGLFDVCLTNPPFGSSESDPEILKAHDLGAGRKAIERAALAMERSIRLTKPGGRIAIVIMDGILANPSTKSVRDYVRKNTIVRGLISLNAETFEAYGGRANTSILLLEKRSAPLTDSPSDSEDVFMAVCRNTGYAANGLEISGNELPEILAEYKAWRSGQAPEGENVWVTKLTDRLDPRHYWRPDTAVSSRADITIGLAGLSLDLKSLQGVVDDLRNDVETLVADIQFTERPLGDLLTEVSEKVVLAPKKEYKLLGVRWWGGGAFIRETKLGQDIKSTSLKKVHSGALVYNRLFAFRASFAIVDPSCSDAVASGEFPMFEANANEYDPTALKKYVVHALNSPKYLGVVDAESSGSTKTSRNRFKQDAFRNFRIAVPTKPEDLEALVALLDRADRLRDSLNELADGSKDIRNTFTGLLEV